MRYIALPGGSDVESRLFIEAHSHADAHKQINNHKQKIRIYEVTTDENGYPYAQGILGGARCICRSVTAKMVAREGTPEQ